MLQSNEDWLVQFMAPWCGHCQRLKPEWEEAAKQLKGDFKLGIVDATQESGLASTYGVKVRTLLRLRDSWAGHALWTILAIAAHWLRP